MSKREKILVLGLAVIGVLVVLQWSITSVRSGFAAKESEIERLQNVIESRNEAIMKGEANFKRMRLIAQSSLPKSEANAREQYQNWLNEVTKDVDLKPHITMLPPTPVTMKNNTAKPPVVTVYKKLTFTMKAQGTIEQLTKFMHRYYDANYLHRLKSVTVRRLPMQPYQLDISLISECLMLDWAADNQPRPTGSSMKLAKSYDEYVDSIVERNLFSPNNLPPKFSPSLASVRGIKNAPLNQTFAAEDPEKDGIDRYEFVDLPRGVRGDRSGRLTGMITEPGKYEGKVIAYDKGIPARSTEFPFTIQVQEPPVVTAPKVKLDVANFATISSLLIAPKSGVTVIVRSKLEAKDYSLKIGDELKLGELRGVLKGAGSNYADFETDGKIWTVHLDESLGEAFKRKSPAVADAAQN